MRAGDEPPIHTHTREDETVHVLEGAITAIVGDQQFEVEAGSYAALPNNVPHGFVVRGEESRLLQPAGAEYFFVPRDESDADRQIRDHALRARRRSLRTARGGTSPPASPRGGSGPARCPSVS